ncbi:hypothetical protein [Caballeronia sp. AZ7_KS35]|uniref:hypothetical protein n=1 Tax=Caballeronia sp. AZ7_KS35 TaxID=2921762 RepID=UPI0020285E0A|nr:hypothetical protein [Caballeronia sp. AZ7_KS35]
MDATQKPKAVRSDDTQIVGIRMTPALAQELKLEATKRGMTLKALFAEMWENHKRRPKS